MRKLLFTLTVSLSFLLSHAQIDTIVTSPPLTGNVSTGTNSGITMNLHAINSINVLGFATNIVAGATGYEIWYNLDSVNGPPNIDPINGWVLHESGPITATGNPGFINLTNSFNIPVGETYGICFRLMGTSVRYTSNPSPSSFSDQNVRLEVGQLVGYVGALPSPSIHPRGFTGQIIYEIAVRGENDAGIASFDNPGAFCAGTEDIIVSVRNFGTNIINNVTVNWTVDGIPQAPVLVSTPLDTLGGFGSTTTQVNLGPLTFAPNQNRDLVIWTSNPNGQPDTINHNDTITRALQPAIEGNYSINAFSLPNDSTFTTFQDFADVVNNFGICGPVVVNVAPGTGPYNERVVFEEIQGTSAVNTITINGNGNVLTHSASSNMEMTTLTLNGTDYMSIDSLTIVAAGSSFGWTLHLFNEAEHNSFTNVRFEADLSGTSTNLSNVSLSASGTSALTLGNTANYTTFENCTFIGGYYGLSMNGTSSAVRNVGNSVINCTFENQNWYATYIRAQDSLTVVGNEISRATRTTTSTFYGLFFTTGISNAIVKDNIIRDIHNALPSTNTSACYPLYMSGATGVASNPNIFANNLIYNINAGGIYYGLYVLGALNNHWKFYHNTVVLDQPTSTSTSNARPVFFSGAQNDFEVKNNIFYLNRPSGTNFMVYMTNATNNVDFDNNVYYTPDPSSVTFGFSGANLNDFSDWQAAGYDLNGLETDPTFAVPGSDYHPTVGSIKSMGTNVLSDVPFDLNGDPRTTTPDPGVFQFDPLPCTGAYDFVVDTLFPGGVEISWQSFGNVTEWQVEWDTCGFFPGSGLGNLDSVVTSNNNHAISMPMGQCFCVYVREKCPGGGYGVWTGPIEVCVPIEYDAELVSLVNPKDLSCGDSLMPITVEIRNNGFFPITSMPITANISGDLTQSLSTTYTGNLLENEVDTVVVGTVNLYNGGYINVETYTSLPNDQFSGNDSLRRDSLLIIPFQPLVTSAEYCPGETNVTVRALPMSSSRYEWFNTATGGTPIGTGDSIVVPVSSGTLYVGYMDNQDSLNTIQQGGSGCGAGNMFDIIPNSTLDITGFTVRPFGTETNMPISVWVVTGGYVGTTQASWTLVESGVIPNAVLNTPVRFNLTNPLTVNANTTYGIYLQFNASYTVGANTYSNSDMTLVAGLGLCAPFDYCCDPRTWNGAIHYGTSACSDIRTPVTPTALDSVQANFTWNTISHTVSFQSTSANADSVVWDFAGLGSATGDSITFQFPQTDSFEVCMIAYNQCGSDTICQMVWAENISVESFDEMLNLRLFPNPNNGTFSLSFLQHLKGDLHIEFIDLSGRVLLNQLYTNHQGAFDYTYDLSHLASGMYQMRLRSPDGTTTRSFVISR